MAKRRPLQCIRELGDKVRNRNKDPYTEIGFTWDQETTLGTPIPKLKQPGTPISKLCQNNKKIEMRGGL